MKLLAPAAFLALAACATVTSGSPALPPGSRYVAMGSSFAAGPQLGQAKPDTPARCARDQENYATLLAGKLNLELVDVTCSGATTAHVLGPWNELPAQLDAVTADTRLVTVTIGGNDVRFVTSLAIAGCDPAVRACPPLRLASDADWAKLEASLREIARQVRSRAPGARLVFVDYLCFVPEGGTCPAVPYPEANVAPIRQMEARFAQITARVARASGAGLLSVGTLSRSHTPCDPEPWSVGMPGTGIGAPWHPNAAGMRGIADALAARLRRR